MERVCVKRAARWVCGSSGPPTGGAAKRCSPDEEAAFGGSGSEDPRTQRKARAAGQLRAGWPLAFVVLCGSGLAAALPLAAQESEGCESSEERRALDFLLGEWRLESGGEVVGRSRVEKLEDGCLIAETWSFADGRSGRTFSSFDAAEDAWRRFSVSSGGSIVRSQGAVDGDGLAFDGERVSADGRSANWRERLNREADGRIARIAGTSRRAGPGDRPSTVFFEGHYVPAGRPAPRPAEPVETVSRPPAPDESAVETLAEAEPPAPAEAPFEAPAEPVKPALATPAAPARVARAAEPAEVPVETVVEPQPSAPEPSARAVSVPEPAPAAGEVTPGSARADDAAVIERIAMASPMVLRLPLGPVESLPAGYAWITRDTAPYLCEGVTIERLQVERRVRRGRVELRAELALQTGRALRRVNVGVELHRGGQPDGGDAVASGDLAGRVGRNIPEQVEHGSVAFEIPLSMDAGVFDEIVADAERPELVVTLTVGR